MKAAFTPGPWSTDRAEHDCPYQDITIQAGKRRICRIWIDDAPCHDYNAEQVANAKLITAAPDLVSVLLRVRGSLPGALVSDIDAVLSKAGVA